MPFSYRGNRNVNILELGRGMRVNRFAPHPPAGVRITGGILYWEPPADGIGITHWRVYANSDGDASLVREVPVGQLSFKDGLVASRVFVSSWSQPYQKESRRVPAVDPAGNGITGMGTGFIYTPDPIILTAPATTVVSPITIVNRTIMVLRIYQDNVGGRFMVFNVSEFPDAPVEIAMEPNARTTYTFAGVSDQWLFLCVANQLV